MERPKLIFITQDLPYPFNMGNKIRMFNILKSLSKHFDVTLACQVADKKNFANINQFDGLCKEVHATISKNKKSPFHRFFYKIKYWLNYLIKNTPKDLYYANHCGLYKSVIDLMKKNVYDVSFFEYWYWPQLVDSATGLKVVDTNDIQYERMEQLNLGKNFSNLLHNRHLQKYRYQEIMTLRKYDILITVTDKDNDSLTEEINRNKIITIPTGVDTDYFIPMQDSFISENIITFYGAMGGKANVDALLFFYNKIFPIVKSTVRDAKLLIIGANPTSEVKNLEKMDNDVSVTGFVQDVRHYLGKGRVSVCPMQVGYGIRGRVLEIMSMAIPVVATQLAVDGMGLQDGHGIMIRNTEAEFAQAVIHLLQDLPFSRKIGLMGRDCIQEKFSCQATYDHLTQLILDALKNTRY